MARPMLTVRRPQIQGQILLDRALFCIGCEVIFTGMVQCPRCGGGTVWPLAEWLRSARWSPVRSSHSEPPISSLPRVPQTRRALPTT